MSPRSKESISASAKASREHGAKAERELANMFSAAFGIKFQRRLVQYQFGGQSDIATREPSVFDKVFIEAKYRAEDPYPGFFRSQVLKYAKSARAAGSTHLVVAYRLKGEKWLAWAGRVEEVTLETYLAPVPFETLVEYLKEELCLN